ncbi:MAG: FAD-dependent monooxygenase [Candidatus Diapherotrites archaeon]|nr:FAD-dependent monooxygenase [Candidatus Diapherotrites archaeon]
MKKISIDEIKPAYDIVVVGSGPAGCSFCNDISTEDYSVLLIDGSKIPRDKPCGGILVKNSESFLSKFDIPENIFSQPKRLDLIYLDLENNITKYSKKNFLNVNRKEFDRWLLSWLDDKNISFLEKTFLIDFYFTKKKDFVVVVLESNSEVRTVVCKYLVGCDGASSVIRRKLYGKPIPHYLAIQQTFDNPGLNISYFIYDNSITDFYSWIIPKGNKLLLGSALPLEDALVRFELLKEKIKDRFKLSNEGKLSAYLICRPNSKRDIFLGKNNIFLVGEAACLISPSSGEGISFALESGKYCAEAFNSKEKIFETYVKKSQSLINRVMLKISKSNKIKDSKKRFGLMVK